MPSSVPPPPSSPASGTPFGRYRLLERIGSGGMAEVYRAVRAGPMGFEKVVAVKRVHPHLTRDNPELARNFINEARLGGMLQHPNLVQVLDFDEEDGAFFLAMEFVDGWTLDHVVSKLGKPGLPSGAVADLALQVCDGLQHAHTCTSSDGTPLHLIHRDLKPGNLMVDQRGTVKILDFGIAKAAANLFQTTATGITRGTPRYMSPEQVEGASLDHRSDLFGLGVCLFEAATGVPLFQAESIGSLLLKVLRADVEGRLRLLEEKHASLLPLLRALLQRDRERRPQDAAEVRRGLEPLRPFLPGPSLREMVVGLTLPSSLTASPPSSPDLSLDGIPSSSRLSAPSPGTAFLPEIGLDQGTQSDLVIPTPTPFQGVASRDGEFAPDAQGWERFLPPPEPGGSEPGGGRWAWMGGSSLRQGVVVGLAILLGFALLVLAVRKEPPQEAVRMPSPGVSSPPTVEKRPSPAPPPSLPLPQEPSVRERTREASPPPSPDLQTPSTSPEPPSSIAASPARVSELPPASKDVSVKLFHRPLSEASVSTSRILRAEVRTAQGSVRVLCRYRSPQARKWQTLELASEGGGIYAAALTVGDEFLGGFEYFLVVEDKESGAVVARDGDSQTPHPVTVY